MLANTVTAKSDRERLLERAKAVTPPGPAPPPDRLVRMAEYVAMISGGFNDTAELIACHPSMQAIWSAAVRGDPLSRQALADACEEEGRPDLAALVRVWRLSVYGREGERRVDTGGIYDAAAGGPGGPFFTVTVNSYGALILNSPYLLMADVDFPDDGPGVRPFMTELLLESLSTGRLGTLDRFAGRRGAFRFGGQSYRVYQTYAGLRVVCTSATAGAEVPGDLFLHYLGADPKYRVMCHDGGRYMARLTPKPWRPDESRVCELLRMVGASTVHPDLAEALRLHDEMTLVPFEREHAAGAAGGGWGEF
jgi:hypothetical protein